jgi:Protocatechuate 3,4-dioxygenase beta subunit
MRIKTTPMTASASGCADTRSPMLQGRGWFDTIVPALQSGRTRHFQFKVQPPGGRLLTTPLYFPEAFRSVGVGPFHQTLLLDLKQTGDGRFGRFDFVI